MKTVSSTLIFVLFLTTAACSGGLVRGEPPLVGVSALELDQQRIRTQVDVYNPNGVEMPVDTVEMSMTLGEDELGNSSQRPALAIHPNGREQVVFDFPAGEAAQQALSELESGAVASLAYSVEGKVSNSAGKSEPFSQQGYLYPVPGRPGQFRGAGPVREQLRDRERDWQRDR